MLQRIQTIFLLLASAATSALLMNPMELASVEGDLTALQAQPQHMLDDGIFHVTDHLLLLMLVGLGIALSLIAIFQFRRRTRQITIVRFALIANLLILLLSAMFFYQDYSNLTTGTYLFEIGYGVLAPIVSIILCALAIRYIRKDDSLVRSMDRLR
ncbi:MAG: DUF4293 domain-containing protein [Saprospiraceae bacterium]|nr:DUF4293 domain-containing protein [Saprospiraceae bacterium]